jgi:hypothetical protein
VAAHEHHAVDRAAAAEPPGGRPEWRAADEASGPSGSASRSPVLDHRGHQGRNPRDHPGVGLAGLEQEHLQLAGFGEARGHRATGRATTDDDQVEHGSPFHTNCYYIAGRRRAHPELQPDFERA